MQRSGDDIYEELLVVRCQRSDVAAWDELVRRYHDRLFYYIRRLIDDNDQATQLVQDVWVHVLRGLATLREFDRLAPWLYTIARRVVMTHFRSQYTKTPVPLNDETIQTAEDQGSDDALTFENAELVHYGLQRIGWVEREVLTLYFLQDLSIEEIARVLEVPAGTVKSRLARARKELRSVLRQEAGIAEEELA
jgi:RNA polymerase sigma factor (sigma-70 family)